MRRYKTPSEVSGSPEVIRAQTFEPWPTGRARKGHQEGSVIETSTKVKERPILFSGEMVRAILEGRKTQTRRVMKPQPADDIAPASLPNPGVQGWKSSRRHQYGNSTAHICPYGQPGDRLWVRETFAIVDGRILYRADEDSTPLRWKPAIFMPRYASRLTPEIVSVRVERVQEISYEDALAEGAADFVSFCEHNEPGELNRAGETAEQTAIRLKWPQRNFSAIWDSINGKAHPWSSNPFVWVIEFKRLETT